MKLYRDFYGCAASIRVFNNGSARLVVRDHHSSIIKTGNYTSERGARIAMGRMSDGWHER